MIVVQTFFFVCTRVFVLPSRSRRSPRRNHKDNRLKYDGVGVLSCKSVFWLPVSGSELLFSAGDCVKDDGCNVGVVRRMK